jgi:hypothetical protein
MQGSASNVINPKLAIGHCPRVDVVGSAVVEFELLKCGGH